MPFFCYFSGIFYYQQPIFSFACCHAKFLLSCNAGITLYPVAFDQSKLRLDLPLYQILQMKSSLYIHLERRVTLNQSTMQLFNSLFMLCSLPNTISFTIPALIPFVVDYFGWINGQTYALIGPLLQGKCISFLSSSDVAKSLKQLNSELKLLSPSVYYTSVAVVRQLVYFSQATKALPLDVPSIKNIGCAGEMLSPSISRSFSKLFGLDILFR